ncbi:hypothetical protein [Emcibacter sp. SYSU 3D8]|uniref:hypothetical protein n=1 Tax=Emcibacter sp. SYSU 3D8 TaxID=3133969 RepID=UPI0031FF24D6
MNQLLDHILACRTQADYYRLAIMAECNAVPSDMAVLFRHMDRLPKESLEWAERTRALMFAQADIVQPFRRTLVSSHVAFFTTRQAPDEPRDLILACCGLVDRLQVPISVVLQHLDGRRFDVLLVRDPTRRIYLQGVPDYGSDLRLVAERIRRDVNLDAYRSVCSLGTSGGGWASFILGSLLGADRAISMSGKPPGLTFRLARMWEKQGYSLDKDNAGFGVFQQLFDSIPDPSTRLLAFFGADYRDDREGAEAFEQMVGAVGIGFRGIDTHNLMGTIVERRRLATFLDYYLTGDLGKIVPPAGQRTVELDSFDQPGGRPGTAAVGEQHAPGGA